MGRERGWRRGGSGATVAVAVAVLGFGLGRGELGWPMRSMAAAMAEDLGRSLDLARLRALESLAPDLRGTANEVQVRQVEQLQQLVTSAHAMSLAYPRTPEGYEAAVIEARTLERLARLETGDSGGVVRAQQAAEKWRELAALGSLVPEPMREEVRYRLVRQEMATDAPVTAWLGPVEGFISTYAASPRTTGIIWEAAGRLERAGEWAQAKRLYGRAAAVASDPRAQRRVEGKLGKIEAVARGFSALVLESADGGRTSLETLRGRVALVHFWATWSEESVSLLRRCVALWQERAPDQIALISVCLDTEGDDALPLASLLPQGVVQVRPGQGLSGPLPERCGVDRVPETWILDPRGRLCSVDPNPEHVAAELTRLLGPPATRPTPAPGATPDPTRGATNPSADPGP